jgi:hypothetical protein
VFLTGFGRTTFPTGLTNAEQHVRAAGGWQLRCGVIFGRLSGEHGIAMKTAWASL